MIARAWCDMGGRSKFGWDFDSNAWGGKRLFERFTVCYGVVIGNLLLGCELCAI